MTPLEEKIDQAEYQARALRDTLRYSIDKIGMVTSYPGQSAQAEFSIALDTYVAALARLEMLRILSTEDFFLAVACSAGETKP